MSRCEMTLVAVVVFAVGAFPAAAQLTCPTPVPGPPPRAGFTCSPLAGGGVATETTCTFYGDVAWLTSQEEFSLLPPGTCSFRLTFDGADWILCPYNMTLDGGIAAGYVLFYGSGQVVGPPVPLPCSIPATGANGLAVLGVLLLAFGVLVLWRRAV